MSSSLMKPKVLKDITGSLPNYITLGAVAADAVVTVGRVQSVLSANQASSRTALGLGSAALASTADFATAAQGLLAGSALQPGILPVGTTLSSTDATNLFTNARVNTAIGLNVSATRTALGLGTAALSASTAFATSAQGVLAGTALQPGTLPIGTTLNNTEANNLVTNARVVSAIGVDAASARTALAITAGLSPIDKLAKLGAARLGFNCFDLLLNLLYGGTQADANAKLDYVVSCGANIARVMYPGFSVDDHTLYVFNSAVISDTVTDATFKPAFLTALDTMMNLAAAKGIKLCISLFWYNDTIATMAGETYLGFASNSNSVTRKHMISHAKWFANRYKNHAAMGIYSIGNEYAMGDGTVAPSEEHLRLLFKDIADAIRSVDDTKIITADLLSFKFTTDVATRYSPKVFYGKLRRAFEFLDAWCIHVYANDTAFSGKSIVDGAAVGAGAGNPYGYECTDALLAALNIEAKAQGKIFIVGEFGVPTDVELDSQRAKLRKHIRQVAQNSDMGWLWNVQIGSQAAANQTKWFIEPNTTRGNKFKQEVLAVQARSTVIESDASYVVSEESKLKIAPRTMFVGRALNTGYVRTVATVPIGPGTEGIGVMAWIRLSAEATIGTYARLIDLRNNTQTSGPVILTGASNNNVYVDFRRAGGSAGNSSSALQDITPGVLYHIAFFFKPVVGGTGYCLDIYLDSMLWKSLPYTNNTDASAIGTALYILGDTQSALGAEVSLQDVSVIADPDPIDIISHQQGQVSPKALIHVRANEVLKTISDVSKNRHVIEVGSSVVIESSTSGKVTSIVPAVSQQLFNATTVEEQRLLLGLGSAALANTTAFATSEQGLLASTALQPGLIPRTFCMWCIPGREASGVAFRDASTRGNHGVIEPSNTGAFATAGKMSTISATAGGIFIYPAGAPINWTTDSAIMSLSLTRATPAAADVIASFGAGANTINAPGLYISHRTSGALRIIANNGAGVLILAADSLGLFSDAGGTTEYHCTIAYDAPTRSLYIYRNGVLDNVNSGLLVGANDFVSGVNIYGPRLGGLGAAIHNGSQASAAAGTFRGWQGYVLYGTGLPINISQISAMLAENPSIMLSDNEFKFIT